MASYLGLNYGVGNLAQVTTPSTLTDYFEQLNIFLLKGELPFLILSGGSAGAKVKPERLPPPANDSDIYISVLTAPVYHDKRFAVQYLTWMQTVDLKNVSSG